MSLIFFVSSVLNHLIEEDPVDPSDMCSLYRAGIPDIAGLVDARAAADNKER